MLADLSSICRMYQDRVFELEGQKWDVERASKIKMLEVNNNKGLSPQRDAGRGVLQLLFRLASFFFLVAADLKVVVAAYFERMYACESHKYDLEYEVRRREYEVQVNTTKSSSQLLLERHRKICT